MGKIEPQYVRDQMRKTFERSGKRNGFFFYSSNIHSENYHDSTQKRPGIIISTELKPLFQCSSWISKSSKQVFLSVLYWLLSGMRSSAGAVKYGLRVTDERNCLEVSILWPKDATDVSILSQSAARTGCLFEDSEIVGFEAATANARISNIQSIESKDIILLPCTVAHNTKKSATI